MSGAGISRGLAAAVACAALAVSAVPLAAQRARPMLEYRTAAAIRDGCVAWATARRLPVAIAVFDDAGRLLAFAQLDGASAAVGEAAQWKARSAAGYRAASADTAKWGGHAPLLADWGGGQPFYGADGVPLGGVGVSGAQTQEDIDCGSAGIVAAGLSPQPK